MIAAVFFMTESRLSAMAADSIIREVGFRQ
jgi:hypothetical protein